MKEKLKSIILNAVIGDALGSPLNGFSRAHIASFFPESIDYHEPGLNRNSIQKWKKPGLYTSISQFMLLSAFLASMKKLDADKLTGCVSGSPISSRSGTGIFRHPGRIEQIFVEGAFNPVQVRKAVTEPGARIIPMVVPASLVIRSKSNRLGMILSLAKLFTSHPLNAAGALFLSDLADNMIHEASIEPGKIMEYSAEIGRKLYNSIDENSGFIFDMKYNPEILLKGVELYIRVFELLDGDVSIEKAESIICNSINDNDKTGIKRATVDNPFTIITFALFLSKMLNEEPGSILPTAVRQGGAASALASVSGIISAGIYGVAAVPDTLVNSLVNRKKILKTLDDIINNKISDRYIDDFLDSEAALTEKELDEYDSRLKLKKEKKKKRSTSDKKSQLNSHIVESWTKADKSRWKKSIRKDQKNKS